MKERLPYRMTPPPKHDAKEIFQEDTESEPPSVGVGRFGNPDPILESLLRIGRWHGLRMGAEQIISGLPLSRGRLTPSLLIRAGQRMGFRIRMVERSLRRIPAAILPVILILKGNRAGILQAEDSGEASFLEAPSAGNPDWRTLTARELKGAYSGFAVFLRPAHYGEAFVSDDDPIRENSGPLRWLWGTVWRFKGELIRLLPVSILINLFALGMSLFIMTVYDRVVPNDAEETLWVLAIGAAIVFSFEYGLRLLRGFLLNRTGKRLDGVLASALFDQIMAMEMRARPLQTGSLVGRARGYEALREFLTSATFVALVDVPFAILITAVVFYLAGWVGWIPLAGTVVAIVFGFLMQFPLRRAVIQGYKGSIERQSLLMETISGLESIKGGNAQNAFQRKMENMIREASDREVRSHWYSLLGNSSTTWIIHLTTISLVVACVYRVYEGGLTMGGMIACVILTSRAMTPLAMVTGLMTRLQQTASSLKGLNQIMGMPREYGAAKRFTVKDSFQPDYTLRDVVVKYPGQSLPALNGVSLRIVPGERVGMIGKVGSGKTTLLKVLAKFYEPESGEILLDGLELSQYHPVTLRRQVGYLPQNPTIFHGSLRDNVAFGTPWVSDEEVFAAVQMAGLGSFVNHHPLGMYAPVGEQGICLSGGQREAIALARCLLNKPKLLLLDEPTASMDVNTEEEVLTNLTAYLDEFPERTLLLSTHKLHLLNIVNRVIVVDQGKVVLDGPKTEVMKKLQRERTTRVVRKGLTKDDAAKGK